MIKRWMLGSLAIVALAGCFGEEHSDLKEWMRVNSEGLRGRVDPLPEVKPYTPFIYAASDLVDPFRPSKMEVAKKSGGSGIAPPINRAKEELEKFDLERLKMLGTLQQGKTIQALIADPSGTLHRVKLGAYMGQNFGMVVGISETEVKLKEIVEDSGGDWVERTTTLNLVEAAEQKK